ncbi:uncharacterized protein A4U43_C10F9550 [Asparagus officinalis]|uniref:RRM domain-containing protein n=1 Tax=Asparagus officinalis TaxID=4686 RepID=A0A5P1E1N1_ASPOF|nr:uncharacterized protein A4U43_C10F9550 [Asparagus officinalis]
MIRPGFPPRPLPQMGVIPQILRPPIPGIRGPPVVSPVVRPVVPAVATEKPQTTVYVSKIAPTVDNDFLLSLLRLCGPVKSWKRAQNPSDGSPTSFGFCEFEAAEGILRFLRLLTKLNIDGQELGLCFIMVNSIGSLGANNSRDRVSNVFMDTVTLHGEETKPFALQFGTISPGIVNGLQIPARTSSAPPNLDEQLRDQAHHDSFRAVPTQPIPPGPKQKSEPARKDVVGIEQSTSELHPPVQVKREVHQQIPTASVAPQRKSALVSMPDISMAMPFQQPPISMQFGTPVLQQMPMTLPIGNASQVPQQMFAHNLQSHPMQHQAMIHQGQGLGFGPQHGLQLGPQFGNLGIAITAPQFSQQQQQPANFGGPRKTTVKITHPETHEELRLDKRTNSHVNGSSSGQRLPRNAGPQSHTITSFTSSHYFPQMQPNSYNPSPIYFPTSTSLTTGSQPPRISYPAGQSGQAISFMNPSLLNPMPVTARSAARRPPVMATSPMVLGSDGDDSDIEGSVRRRGEGKVCGEDLGIKSWLGFGQLDGLQ